MYHIRFQSFVTYVVNWSCVFFFLPYQVWDSTSGHELFTLEGGTTSAVTFCCFKPTSHSIVGVSDTVAKVRTQEK